MIAVVLVQIGVASALWHLAGPWGVACWAAVVCAPAIVRRLA